jgi:hypothetical protein
MCPESFYQRLTNILQKDFQLKNLFFLRLSHKIGTESYQIKKSSYYTSARATLTGKLCRRWISIRTIEAAIEEERTLLCSNIRYDNSNNEYLVFSSATQDPFKKDP